MMSAVETRTNPFKYFEYRSENLDNKGIISKISTRVSEVFYNCTLLFFNIGIATGNALKLYKLQRVEVKPVNCAPQRWQIANFALHAIGQITGLKPNLILDSKNPNAFELIMVNTLNPLSGYIKVKYLNESLTDGKVSLLGQMLWRNVPVLSLINCTWETYHVAKKSICSLTDCKKLAEKKPLDALKYSIVHAGSFLIAITNLYREIMVLNYLVGVFPYSRKGFDIFKSSKTNTEKLIDREKLAGMFEEYMRRGDNRFGRFECRESLISKFFSSNDYLRDKRFDPTCVNFAVKMAAPKSGLHEGNVCSEGNYRQFKKEYRASRLSSHPDKPGGSQEISERLSNAYDTVKKMCSFDQRHEEYLKKPEPEVDVNE